MWERVTDGTADERWEREDGTAAVWIRETADGRWAVTLDRLEQAPEGPAYRRATVEDRATAVERARSWREDDDTV